MQTKQLQIGNNGRTLTVPKVLYRAAQTIDRSAINDTARTVRMSISSSIPYKRTDVFGKEYFEVLSHATGDVILDRLMAGAALLWNHSRDSHLGRNTEVENDGQTLRVTAKFSRSAFAQEKWDDLTDGILTDCSVGYEVLDAEEQSEKIDGVPVFLMKWQPYEFSLVTIAADTSVGVGRNHNPQSSNQFMNPNDQTTTTTERPNTRTAEQERERIQDIYACAKIGGGGRVPEGDVERAISEGWSKNKFRDHVMEIFRDSARPIQTDSDRTREFRTDGDTQTIGGMIVGHRDFQKVRTGGKKSVTIEFPHISNLRAFTTADIGGGVMQTGAPVFRNEKLVIADLLAQGTTTSATIRYPQENAFVPASTTVAEGAQKPEQVFDVDPTDAQVRKLAAWCHISDELLEDSPGAQAYINSRLGFAVQKEEDNQILNGSGTGTNMKGILFQAGLQTQARGADTGIDAIRKGIGRIDTNTDFSASGVVLHPTNWQNIEMLKDANNQYLCGHVFVVSEMGVLLRAPSIWGLPIAVSKSIAAGTALVGAFSVAAQLFRRKGLTIEMTNSDGTDFQLNMLKIRAELRAGLAVYAPPAFCQVTGLI